MPWIVAALLVLVIVAFGWSSGMQSYATAQQAQAQIEVAQVAQINAWGNVITILIVGLVVLLMLALFLFIGWLWLQRAMNGSIAKRSSERSITESRVTMLDKEQMTLVMQMKMLQMLD